MLHQGRTETFQRSKSLPSDFSNVHFGMTTTKKQDPTCNVEPPVSPARSRNMKAVGSKNTMPEMRVRRAAFSLGYRYRLYDKRLPGHPDLVFPGRRTALFVHGCFWHQHVGCSKATLPVTRRTFWEAKLNANVERDQRTEGLLRAAGWRVFVIWECETKNEEALRTRLREVLG